VDADIVDFPLDLFSELVRRAEGGIAAPIQLLDGELGTGPVNSEGFGYGRVLCCHRRCHPQVFWIEQVMANTKQRSR
jgi:hypothetical protein